MIKENTSKKNHISNAVTDFLKKIEYEYNERKCIKTGFPSLDAKIQGFNAGELILIGGYPCMGKAQFTMATAYNIAKYFHNENLENKQSKRCVLYLNLACSNDIFARDLLRSQMKMSIPDLSYISEEKMVEITKFCKGINELPLYCFDTINDITGIRKAINKLQQYQEIGCIFIDYLQMLECEDKDFLISGLKELAMKYNVPVIAMTQLKKQREYKICTQPTVWDIRDYANQSIGIADKILLLHREHYYIHWNEPVKRKNETDENFNKRHFEWKNKNEKLEHVCEIIIAKNDNFKYYNHHIKMYTDYISGYFAEYPK